MAVAATVHRQAGPFAQDGGYELPVTNLALALGLAATGPGALRLGPHLPKSLTRLTTLGAIALSAGSIYRILNASPPATSPAESTAESVGSAADTAAEAVSDGAATVSDGAATVADHAADLADKVSDGAQDVADQVADKVQDITAKVAPS
jgi:hypothetical protein